MRWACAHFVHAIAKMTHKPSKESAPRPEQRNRTEGLTEMQGRRAWCLRDQMCHRLR